MTLTDCMKPSLSGGGFDCKHCGLHVDECVQEDDSYLQDERYRTESQFAATETGQIIRMLAQRTLIFSDSARASLSERKSTSAAAATGATEATTSNLMDPSVIFADAPLSNARQPALNIFTFRHSQPTETSMDHNNPLCDKSSNNSPRFTIRTIPRRIASSTSGESTVSEDVSSIIDIAGEDLRFAPVEVSVDWPEPYIPEVDEISVDGLFDYLNVQRPKPAAAKALFEEPPVIRNTSNATLPANELYYDNISSSDLDGRSQLYSSPEGMSYIASSTPAGSVTPIPAAAMNFPLKEIDLWKLFYPNRVQAASPAVAQHVPVVSNPRPHRGVINRSDEYDPINARPKRTRVASVSPTALHRNTASQVQTNQPQQQSSAKNTIITPRSQSQRHREIRDILQRQWQPVETTTTEIITTTDHVVTRQILPLLATTTATHGEKLLPASPIGPAVAAATGKSAATGTTQPIFFASSSSTDRAHGTFDKSRQVQVQPQKQQKQVEAYNASNGNANVPVRESGKAQKTTVRDTATVHVEPNAAASTSSTLHEVYRHNPVKRKQGENREKRRVRTSDTRYSPDSKDTDAGMQAATRVYNVSPTVVAGNSFTKTRVPTDQYNPPRERFDFISSSYDQRDRDRDGGASTVSSITLPLSENGSKGLSAKYISQPKAQAAGYASSELLDGYATSPSPSLADSNFSLASRGSGNRLSRRSHATIYLKSQENGDINGKKRNSKVDLTVESEVGVPVDDLRRSRELIHQQQIRRSSSSSSSSGRGIQRLTIKMLLKEKKDDVPGMSGTSSPITPAAFDKTHRSYVTTSDTPPSRRYDWPNGTSDRTYVNTTELEALPLRRTNGVPDRSYVSTTQTETPPPRREDYPLYRSYGKNTVSETPPLRRDDLPNGATAASTTAPPRSSSYQRNSQPPGKLAEGELHRRAFSSAHSTPTNNSSRYYNSSSQRTEAKPWLSASEVELYKTEIISAAPQEPIMSTTSSLSREPGAGYYVRRPASNHDSVSRLYTPSSMAEPIVSKAVPYRSYERLDIENEDGGKVMREVLEELKNNVISVQVHEKVDGLTKEKIRRIQNGEESDLERLQPSRPNIEKAMTSESSALALPEKPPSPPRSRRDKYELHQAMSWKREIELPGQLRGASPVNATEVEYEVHAPPADRTRETVVREETRVAEIRSVSAPATKVLPETRSAWYPDKQRPASPLHTSMMSSTMSSTTATHRHVQYRSIFDKSFTDERVNELRKSANDLRALADNSGLGRFSSTSDREPVPGFTSKPSNSYSTNKFKCSYPPPTDQPAPLPSTQRPLPPYTSLNSDRFPTSTAYKSTIPPIAPPRSSSSRHLTTAEPPETKSYTYDTQSKTTNLSTTTYQPPERRAVEKDPEFKYITQYKSTPSLLPTSNSRVSEPLKSTYYNVSTPSQPEDSTRTSFAWRNPRADAAISRNAESPTSAFRVPEKPSGQLSSEDSAKESYVRRHRDAVTSVSYAAYRPDELLTGRFKPLEKPSSPVQRRTDREPGSRNSSWAYGYKLPDEPLRQVPAERPASRVDSVSASRREPPTKPVEPAIIEALKTKKKPSPPSSPDIRPKDWVPPCKAKILQAKRKYMSQMPPFQPPAKVDPWERYRSGSREKMQLRISRESLDAINKEANRGQRISRSSAPDLSGSQKTLTDPSVYRSKIQWPEREIQAKLSESQEYLARRYDPDYALGPTTTSFANRWDARSRSLPPMSRYSKSAATTPIESPYPEYMDSNKAKSMEFLADVKKFDYQIVPENQLQRENISGYSRSRQAERDEDNPYTEQVRKSLQKLDLPEWYVNSPYSQPGAMEGTILRHRAHSTSESNYSPYATLDRNSAMTSPTGTMQSTDAVVLSKRILPPDWNRDHARPTKPLSTSRDEKVWDLYTGPYYNKKARPAPIYSPASESHRPRPQYNPHDSGWSSDWNSHHESSQDSDESNTDSRLSPRAWNASRKPVPAAAPQSSSSSWYRSPIDRRRDQSEPARVGAASYVPHETDSYRNVPRASPAPTSHQPSTYFDPSLSQRRIIQTTPWEVISVKTETIKNEHLARKNFVTETNDPVKISQLSQGSSQWGSYV